MLQNWIAADAVGFFYFFALLLLFLLQLLSYLFVIFLLKERRLLPIDGNKAKLGRQ